ncbi:MFS transporter [Tersicoccus sp. Bi-70]|uniref:MFS transporter n=1 Tax=Tersicoccus sp. Bi-70 TaxID=1897634 RepID=UPI00097871F8|nr:MFS transporter [Tersicoccus sp. Bi-70]OMH31253.1 MFS transporter [Tersicoccus sp. Bi-70]
MSSPRPAPPSARAVAPLYAAGFTTAFGAHSVAAGLGAEVGAARGDVGAGLLALGVFLALYDLAEVVLKPVFGSLADRIGPRPVIVAGLLGFAVASLIGIGAASPVLLAVARLGQGAAASAFSPASSAAVARLAGPRSGRSFGRYGSWKSLGYALGPLIGAGLILAGGLPLLFGVLAVIALVAAGWAAVAVPAITPLPRPRYTLTDLARQLVERSFLGPTAVLAAATGSLGAAVGFLPAIAAASGLGTVLSIGAVTVLALASALIQPVIGRARDAGRLADRPAMAGGLGLIAVGIVAGALAAVTAGVAAGVLVYLAAALIGAGIAVTTPIAFAHLADAAPPERMGRTMGTAELGRELGDAGGPLLVGAVAAAAGIGWGLGALAVVVGLTATAAPRSPTVADS